MGRCTKLELGRGKKGVVFRGQMTIEEGPRKGTAVEYEGKLDDRAIKWTKRDLEALGWAGKSSKTAVDDVMKANRLVSFKVEIAEWNKDDGTVKRWSSVRSIGTGPKPLEKLDDAAYGDIDGWFNEAAKAAPPPDDDGLPF